MKKLFLIMLLSLFAMPIQAGDDFFSIIFEDIITAADTNTVRTTVLYSPWREMKTGRFLSFASRAEAYSNDTNWGDDSLWFDFQMKFSKSSTILTFEIDTLLTIGDAFSPLLLDADATVLPTFGRFRFTHWDSIGTGDADSALVNTLIPYSKKVTLFYNWR